MLTIAMHMSMLARRMRIEEGISIVGTEVGMGACCRGLIARPVEGNTVGGVESSQPRDCFGGSGTGAVPNEAGTSRARRRGDCRRRDGGSDSESG